MPRTGTRPTSGKVTGSTQTATQQTYVDEKALDPGLNDAWSSTVKFDDEYFPPDKTMTGAITYTIDATNAGTGNGRKDTVIGDGNTITFTGFTIRKSSLTPTSNVVTTVSGNTYTIVFLRVGSVSEVYLVDNAGTTPGFALALSNFSIEDANKDRVYFDTNQAPTGTTYAGFTLATPSKTITGVIFNTGNTTGHYFTVSAAYVVGDTSPTIAYDGTDDWTGTGGALAAFTATAITNNIGLTQLSAVTLGTVTPSTEQVTIAVTNPNSSNEDQNQLYYKLNTEPTTWTTGAVMATAGTSVIQTGLTNDLLYNFKMVAEGDGITYSDSADSNTVNGTPILVEQSLAHTVVSAKYITLPTTGFLDFTSVPFSISCFVRATDWGTTNVGVELFTDNGVALGGKFMRVLSNTSSVEMYLYDDPESNSLHIRSSVALSLSTWYHIVFTYDGSNTETGMNFYIDKVLDSSATKTENGTFVSNYAPQVPAIGGNQFGGSFENKGIGQIDQMAFWNIELSQSQVNEFTTSQIDLTSLTFSANLVDGYNFDGNSNGINGNNGTAVGTDVYSTEIPP